MKLKTGGFVMMEYGYDGYGYDDLPKGSFDVPKGSFDVSKGLFNLPNNNHHGGGNHSHSAIYPAQRADATSSARSALAQGADATSLRSDPVLTPSEHHHSPSQSIIYQQQQQHPNLQSIILPISSKIDNRSQKRSGGVADLESLAGEEPVFSSETRWSWWWLAIFLFIIVIIGLLIWWIIVIMMPKKVKDFSARDISARDIAACGNVTIAGQTVLAGKTRMSNALAKAFSVQPLNISDLNVILDGTESCITLTNQSGSIVNVTLPSSADYKGLILFIMNESLNSTFHVEPAGTDTIEGSNAIAVENSSALFVSVGVVPSGLADWKQIM